MSNYVFTVDHADPVAEAVRIGATCIRCESLADAEAMAAKMTARTGDRWIAYQTTYAFSRYVAVPAPKVGDPVSYAFNGDSYPDGEIATISPTLAKIVTTTGTVYNRQKTRPGAWMRKGGTFSMVKGHVNKRNPHF